MAIGLMLAKVGPVQVQSLASHSVDEEVAAQACPRQRRRPPDAGRRVGSDLDLETVLQRIVATAAELVDATFGALGVLDDTGTRLAQFLTVGIDDAGRAAIGNLPEGHGILGLLIVDPRPLRLSD